MTLPSSGPISLSAVNTELGLSATALISLNDAATRGLAGVPSGTISMSNLQGKSNVFAFTISSNQTDANLRTLAVAAGWDQSLAVVATIGSGVVISGSVLANSTPALTINGSWSGGVRLVNNGTIAGRGGTGAPGAKTGGSAVGGGRAMTVSVAVSIDNTSGIIAGGGGGGAGGAYASGTYDWYNNQSGNSGQATGYTGGGGGGGGQGGNVASTGGAAGSASGGAGNAFINGQAGGPNPTAGGAGGLGGAGGGGTGGTSSIIDSYGNLFSVSGGNGTSGGGWGQAGGASAAGDCLSGNANITWIATGTRYGAVV